MLGGQETTLLDDFIVLIVVDVMIIVVKILSVVVKVLSMDVELVIEGDITRD